MWGQLEVATERKEDTGPAYRVVLLLCSVPTFTVIPEGPRSPSPLMVVDNEEEPMEGVPLEQYRAWLGEKELEVGKQGSSLYLMKGRRLLLRREGILSVPVLTWPHSGAPPEQFYFYLSR